MENYSLLYGITQFTETASTHYKLSITLTSPSESSQSTAKAGGKTRSPGWASRWLADCFQYKRAEGDWLSVHSAVLPPPGRSVLKGALELPSGKLKEEEISVPPPRPSPLPVKWCVLPDLTCCLLPYVLSLLTHQGRFGLAKCVRIHKCLCLHLDQGHSVTTGPE